ncbi:major capsid protein [Streptomyces sp. NBC_01725]|uniref:major capsid protein n=1 Tax=unclassified Streptomyces TaxID=2593676 RepID=UPI002E2C1886|nr:major capsid protein [Streptomyces sp. NBC_01725]
MSWTLDTEFIEPTQLTGLIREALAQQQVNRFRLARWLPNVEVDDIVFEFVKGGGGLAETASYRSWDTESKIGRREGIGKVMGELPPISEKIPLNEYDRLRLRKLTRDDALPFIARDANRIATNIAARFEVGRGSALVNGTVPVPELKTTVDFGRTASHSVVAAVLWTVYATAKPLTDLQSWVQTYEDTNGETPAVILMPKAVLQHMMQCDQVIRQVYPLAPAGTAPMATVDQVNGVLASMGLPPIELYDARVKVDGVATRITPGNAIALLPEPGEANAAAPTDLGATLLGTTAEALEEDYGLQASEQPGIVAGTWKTKDPVRLWTHAAAVGIPVLREPNLTLKAQVLA